MTEHGGTREVVIASWEMFEKEVSKMDQSHGHFVYRGQKDFGWSLESSLARLRKGLDESREIEMRLHTAFMRRSTTLLHPSVDNVLTRSRNIFLWWGQMRHHGAPTRTLDWTRSPYVAAYFACESGMQSGAVWCLNQTALARHMKEEYRREYDQFVEFLTSTKNMKDPTATNEQLYAENAPHLIAFLDSHLLTERMERQQGMFSYSNLPHRDHADAMNHPAILTKLVILEEVTCALKREFMHQLRLMNITGFSLFPDLDGIGRYCTEIARHNADAN